MTAMELIDQSVPAKTCFLGNQTVTASSKEKFKIQIRDDEILKVAVPDDKQWQIKIFIEIIETDA